MAQTATARRNGARSAQNGAQNAGRQARRLSPEEIETLDKLRAGQLVVQEPQPEPDPDAPGADIHYFELTPAQLASVRTGRGRRPEESLYVADVREAKANPGKYLGFRVTDEEPAEFVISQLRKAARAVGLASGQFSIFNRGEKEGFVSFVAHSLNQQ